MSYLGYLIGSFVGLTLVFHLALLRFKHRPLLWKFVDYIWLTVAMLGVFATGLGIHLEDKEYELDVMKGSLTTSQAFTFIPIAVTLPKYAEAAKHVAPEKVEMYEQELYWFEAAEKLIRDKDVCSTLVFPHYPFEKTQPHPDPEIQADKELFIGIIQDIQKQCDEIATLDEDVWDFHLLKYYAKIWGPILLAFAIALRITKTTASIKGYT